MKISFDFNEISESPSDLYILTHCQDLSSIVKHFFNHIRNSEKHGICTIWEDLANDFKSLVTDNEIDISKL